MHKIGMRKSFINKIKEILIKQIEKPMQIVLNKKICRIKQKRNYLKKKV